MAFLEGNFFIDPGEYDAYRKKRVDGDDAQLDEIYTVMLKAGGLRRRAAKMTARLIGKTTKSSLLVLEFDFLNQDLQLVKKAESEIHDGIMTGLDRQMDIRSKVNTSRTKIKEAYLRDYDDDGLGMSLELLKEMEQSLEII